MVSYTKDEIFVSNNEVEGGERNRLDTEGSISPILSVKMVVQKSQHMITTKQKWVTGAKVEKGYFLFMLYLNISYEDYMLPVYIACVFISFVLTFWKVFIMTYLVECVATSNEFWLNGSVATPSDFVLLNQIGILFLQYIQRFSDFQTWELWWSIKL